MGVKPSQLHFKLQLCCNLLAQKCHFWSMGNGKARNIFVKPELNVIPLLSHYTQMDGNIWFAWAKYFNNVTCYCVWVILNSISEGHDHFPVFEVNTGTSKVDFHGSPYLDLHNTITLLFGLVFYFYTYQIF